MRQVRGTGCPDRGPHGVKGGYLLAVSVSQAIVAPDAPAAPLAGLPARIVLFDGVCVVCERSVDWLLQRDVAAQLCFAPLQGETAARIRQAFPGSIPDGIDTVVYVDRSGAVARLWLRTAAIREILGTLGGGPRYALLRAIPTPLADLGYRAFARVRYWLFGRRDSCRVPTAAERQRFLP